MQNVFASIMEALGKGQSVVRVSVMKSNGSTPRSAGAVMAVFEGGSTAGTIGGGSVENASHMAAKKMQPGTSTIREFDLTNADAANLGMVCGGNMTVLLDSLLPDDANITLIKKMLAHWQAGEHRLLVTSLSTSGTVTNREIFPLGGTFPDTVRTPMTTETPDSIQFVEPVHIPETVHFIGAGHVANATAKLAAFVGFRVVVVDDREEFANAVRYPEASEIRVEKSLTKCLPESLDKNDFIVIMTRGHMHDRDVLAQALRTKAGYIGMIGSKKKKAAVYKSLLESGYTQTALDAVHCPIGLTIDADTPEEIAISIMGELIQSRKQN
nr:XdhC family protein [Pseudodesulfovibrio sp.]